MESRRGRYAAMGGRIRFRHSGVSRPTGQYYDTSCAQPMAASFILAPGLHEAAAAHNNWRGYINTPNVPADGWPSTTCVIYYFDRYTHHISSLLSYTPQGSYSTSMSYGKSGKGSSGSSKGGKGSYSTSMSYGSGKSGKGSVSMSYGSGKSGKGSSVSMSYGGSKGGKGSSS
eukprot:scaffold24969_cov72-Skeletonema_dohrnii-CCMP3373.AAC.1